MLAPLTDNEVWLSRNRHTVHTEQGFYLCAGLAQRAIWSWAKSHNLLSIDC
jgi:hypothetical protein